MKTNQRIIIILMFMMMAGLSDIYAQNKREIKEQREQAIKEQIIAEKYKISVNTAYPRRGRTVHLSSPYSVEIRNDSVISYLPFYGRAYSIPYGGGEGLIFQAPLDEYEMEMNKKGTAKVKFTARSPEDKFTFNLTIYSNGSASINVNMQPGSQSPGPFPDSAERRPAPRPPPRGRRPEWPGPRGTAWFRRC